MTIERFNLVKVADGTTLVPGWIENEGCPATSGEIRALWGLIGRFSPDHIPGFVVQYDEVWLSPRRKPWVGVYVTPGQVESIVLASTPPRGPVFDGRLERYRTDYRRNWLDVSTRR